MLHVSLVALSIFPSHAAPQLGAIVIGDHSAGMLLVAALFYFGFKWRAK